MTELVIRYDSDAVITGFDYVVNGDIDLGDNELIMDTDTVDHRSLLPLGSKRLASTDPPSIEANPEYVPTDILDRGEIDPSLKQTYRDARDTYLAERQNFIDAKQAADVQGQLDALASLAENATVPALDALFQVAMGEEP